MALAKARLAELAHGGGAGAPAAADRVATLVRARPWSGVGVALGLGLVLGLSRGRGARAVGEVVGPLSAALASGLLRQFVVGSAGAASALEAKAADVRSRTGAR